MESIQIHIRDRESIPQRWPHRGRGPLDGTTVDCCVRRRRTTCVLDRSNACWLLTRCSVVKEPQMP